MKTLASAKCTIDILPAGKHEIRQKAYLTRVDDSEFNFEFRFANLIRYGYVEHKYGLVAGGSSFMTRFTRGVAWLVARRFLNRRLLLKLNAETLMRDWLAHNIEETGETERFVPILFEHVRAAPRA